MGLAPPRWVSSLPWQRERVGPEGQRRSVRAVVTTWALVFGAIALVTIAALVCTSTLLRLAIEDVIRDTTSMDVADEIQLQLLEYDRLSVLNGSDPSVAAARDEARRELRAQLERARTLVASERERQLVREVDAGAETYVQERAGAEARGLDAAQIQSLVRPNFERTLAAIEDLRALNEAAVNEAHRSSLRIDALTNIAGVATSVLLLGLLLIVVLGARRYVIRPLEDMHGVLHRFRGGDLGARAEPSRSRELNDIGATLNELIEATARHREAQLTFIGGVAHDLRNPLSALRMGIEVAKGDRSEVSRARVLDMVDRQVGRLTRMVGDLLEATRIEAGKLELHRERVDLRQIARDTVRLYEPSAPRHELVLHVPEHPVSIDADPLRMEQVASNLVSNAVKYAPEGGRIDVGVRASDHEAILEVRDRGVGIPREQMKDLFAPFRRLATGVAQGAGLGLSVVRRIVEAHGGHIEVDSVVGEGSTFRVHVPLHEPA